MRKTIKKIVILIAIMLIALTLNYKVNAETVNETVVETVNETVAETVNETVEEKITESGLKYIVDSNPDEEYVVINGITDTTVKTLQIPDTIEGYPVREISENAFKGNKSLEKVVFSSNLKIVDTGAFSGCSNLKEVVLKGKDLSLYPRVFEGTAIETLKFTNSLITGHNRGLDSSAFQGMNKLKSIYFEMNEYMFIWDNEYVTDPLTEEAVEYLRKNVTIYGYTSKYEQDDALNNVTLSPKAFAISRGIKFVDLDTLVANNSLTDEVTKITVWANMSKTAKITVTALDKTSEEYKNIVKDLEDYEVALAYDISITAGDYEGTITVTLPVDNKYNGQTAIILHKKSDGKVEPYTSIATDGKVEVKVDGLSPFVVAFKTDTNGTSSSEITPTTPTQTSTDKTPATTGRELDDSPKMGVEDYTIVVFALVLVSIIGVTYVIKKD